MTGASVHRLSRRMLTYADASVRRSSRRLSRTKRTRHNSTSFMPTKHQLTCCYGRSSTHGPRSTLTAYTFGTQLTRCLRALTGPSRVCYPYYMHVYTICMFVCIYMYICIHMCVCVCVCACVCVYTYVFLHTCAYTQWAS
jgi:hypothetical protein